MNKINKDEFRKLTKYPYTIALCIYAYKTKGLWYAIKLIFSITRLSIFTWSYKHIKFVRNRVNKRLNDVSPYLQIMFEMSLFQDFNLEKAIWCLPEKELGELLEKNKRRKGIRNVNYKK